MELKPLKASEDRKMREFNGQTEPEMHEKTHRARLI